MTRTDAIGVEHTRADEGARIVSLVPSLTETLFALGLGRNVVGRTKWCIHPAQEVARVPSVGGTKKINLERFEKLAPTHAVMNIDENPREMFDAIAALGVETIVTHPNAPEDNRAVYRLLGSVFGREEEAERLCAAFEEAWGALREAVAELPPKRVLYLIWRDPWMTVSRDTYIGQTLGTIGWETAGHDPHLRYPSVTMTPELLAELDLVLFSSEPYAFREDHLDAFAREHEFPREHLRLIDGEMTSWYGVRAIEGLRYLTRIAGEW